MDVLARRTAVLGAVLLPVLAVVLTACGSNDNGGASGGSGKGAGGLVAKVSAAHVKVANGTAVATTTISIGGVAGRHVVLKTGLIDALQGSESEAEKVLHRYVTTTATKTYPETLRIPMKTILQPSLVHFVIYAPDGSFLSSSDTPEFGD
jgi:hypothetical protein